VTNWAATGSPGKTKKINITGETVGSLVMSAGTAQAKAAASNTINTRCAALIMSSSPQDGHWTTRTAGAGGSLAPQDGHCLGLDVTSKNLSPITVFCDTAQNLKRNRGWTALLPIGPLK
jgi:hypothetical protein